MKITARLILFSLFVLFLTDLSAFSAQQIIARVGGLPVTMIEVSQVFNKILPLSGSYHGGVDNSKKKQVFRESFDTVVERTMKARYAISNELAGDPEYVNDKMSKLIKKFGGEENLLKQLKGVTLQELRGSFYRESLAIAAEKFAVDDEIDFNPSEAKKYYDDNRHRYVRPKQFQASHILVKVDPSSNAEEREERLEKANKLKERAIDGEDFYDLAYYNSDDRSRYVGGDLGTFHVGQTIKEFEDAVLEMEPGDISDLVETIYGYHIIKLISVEKERQLTFDEVKQSITQDIISKKRDELYSAWMSELKNTYKVEKLIEF